MDVLADTAPREAVVPPLSSLAPHVSAALIWLEQALLSVLDRAGAALAPPLSRSLPAGWVPPAGDLGRPSDLFCEVLRAVARESASRGRLVARELSERAAGAYRVLDPKGEAYLRLKGQLAEAAAAAKASAPVSAARARFEPLFESLSASLSSSSSSHLCCPRACLARLSSLLAALSPLETLLLGVLLALVLSRLVSALCALRRSIQDHGLRGTVASRVLALPWVRALVLRQVAAARAELEASEREKSDPTALRALPEHGWSTKEVEAKMRSRARRDVRFDAASKVSGAVYMAGEEHKRLLMEAYATFALSNPLHADVFPSARTMEVEVVRMTASMFGGGPGGAAPGVCGAMTSGGSESIFMAVKVAREVAVREKGVRRPELLAPISAHAAFVKAAEYFGLRLRTAPVDPETGAVDVRAMARLVNRNTALLVASCPGFPHGVADPIADVAELARRSGTLCHVDCCLGGFVVPFRRRLGLPTPPFDFALPGVTSISADTHKFGMAHKGTSVVLYRSAELRKHQFTAVTEWTGGLYISPGPAGSRSGALIATAWASMVHLGWDGYCALTKRLLDATSRLRRGIDAIPEIEVIGDPIATVVAFRAVDPKRLNVYLVNDRMVERGWHLNPLQNPPAVHVCLTAAHLEPDAVEPLLKDLGEVVAATLDEPAPKKGSGSAPIYGAAATIPDPSIVGAVLEAYQNVMLDEC